ncbi:hypothetical protein SLH46_06630 [Draconibacterium sp. IB214405]|nr:hypothetical protein [Draconibacterium sp. IB214405]
MQCNEISGEEVLVYFSDFTTPLLPRESYRVVNRLQRWHGSVIHNPNEIPINKKWKITTTPEYL